MWAKRAPPLDSVDCVAVRRGPWQGFWPHFSHNGIYALYFYKKRVVKYIVDEKFRLLRAGANFLRPLLDRVWLFQTPLYQLSHSSTKMMTCVLKKEFHLEIL